VNERISFEQVKDAVLDYALDEKRSAGWNGGLWKDYSDLMKLISEYGKQRERKGYLRGLRDGLR
jgi:hypothetical protein